MVYQYIFTKIIKIMKINSLYRVRAAWIMFIKKKIINKSYLKIVVPNNLKITTYKIHDMGSKEMQAIMLIAQIHLHLYLFHSPKVSIIE